MFRDLNAAWWAGRSPQLLPILPTPGRPGRRPTDPAARPRHTCASLLVELDIHPRVAMQFLRHAKIATTMDIYSHVPTAATCAALEGLSR
jgi:hypothetical protein